MLYLISFVQMLFLVYSVLIIVKVLSSWFPKFSQSRLMRSISVFTDPYLNFFRRFIPSIGGKFDISAIIAFIALRIAERIVLYALIWIHSLLI
ncbi:YggT family protein [Candidatus Aerophobetes bacterium]|uniref:YggT family protein n=1 Tax=Aerophobetes bacterium TaxID=2030807 RepID=A0A2A4X3H6_UNCAE|nr:MAG: YggT family protein [Candidatus Aerophobetes bacterium]